MKTMPRCYLDPERIKAAILDMDGVLTDTAGLHEAAWAALFDDFLEQRGDAGRPFTSDDYRHHVDGKPRLDGIRDFLASRDISLPGGTTDDPPGTPTLHGLGRQKNEAFRTAIDQRGITAFDDAVALLERLEQAGIAKAVISASRNAEDVLRAAELRHRFAVLIDGIVAAERGLAGKPAPDVFLAAAAALGVEPDKAAVVEDAVSGIEAARSGGFAMVIGIARTGEAAAGLGAAGADAVVRSLDEISLSGA